MARKKAAGGCRGDCRVTPTAHGYYWATRLIQFPAGKVVRSRGIFRVGLNGHKHLRVFSDRYSGSFGLEEFTD